MLTDAQRIAMLSAPTGQADVVIDSDTFNEIDDQFAIALALRSPERMRVKALYAAPFFNEKSQSPEDGMEKSCEEMLRLLRLMGEERPVLRGSNSYLKDEKTPVLSDAARDLAQRAMDYSPEKPLYVVAIGAITNVASALLLNPAIADRLVVVWLGGHALEWPDIREFNLDQDVAAARAVFASGAPLVLVPCCGVATTFTVTGPELAFWLKGKGALAEDLMDAAVRAAESYAKGKVWSRVLWDVTAMAWLLNDGQRFLRDRLIPTPIPEYDLHWGFDPCRPLCRYVYFVNRDRLLAELFSKITGQPIEAGEDP